MATLNKHSCVFMLTFYERSPAPAFYGTVEGALKAAKEANAIELTDGSIEPDAVDGMANWLSSAEAGDYTSWWNVLVVLVKDDATDESGADPGIAEFSDFDAWRDAWADVYTPDQKES